MMDDALDLRVIMPPAVEPVDMAAARLYCRVDHTDEDAVIAAAIATARARVESNTGRALVTRTLEVRLDAWPARLYLPFPPAVSVVSVTAVDADGAETVVDTGAYALRDGVEPGCVHFDSALLPTVTLADFGGVRVRYTAGYGAADDVPADLKWSIALLLKAYYERVTVDEAAYNGLIGPYRVFWFGEWAQP